MVFWIPDRAALCHPPLLGASRVPASRRALLIHPSTLLSVGLLVALASAVPALIVGRPFMSALWTEVGTGKAAWAIGTPLVFDVGVFLAVIGVVLTIVFTLAED